MTLPMKYFSFTKFMQNDYTGMARSISNDERSAENDSYPDFSALTSIIENLESWSDIDPENDIFSETGLSQVQGVDNTYEDEVSSLDEIDDVFFPAMSTSRANEIGETNSSSSETQTAKRVVKRRERRKPLESKTLLAKSLMEWLEDPTYNPEVITWTSKEEGLFQIKDSITVAKLWGSMKGNDKMTHEKLSRALRHYYNDGTLVKIDSGKRKLHYKFSAAAMKKFKII